MVGDGPQREAVHQLLAQAGLDHLAWLPGECHDVAPMLCGLHAFALPSRSEGISNAILEAMASGLPVLATAVGGNAELVLPGVTGYLTPPQDPQAMASHLIALAGNPYLTDRLGQAGRQRVLNHFSLPTMVATYQRVYAQQLQRHGAHALRH
jgi:glycosyltransferase involved in cell wall biosynthesis